MFLEINSRRIPLESGNLYLLGKQINTFSDEHDTHFIKLEHKDDVDEKHCVIEVTQNKDVYIIDLYSSQGTLLNNQPLKGLQKMPLKNSDIIRVGVQQITFFYDNELQEMSPDSSGFLDNRNISDIVSSSPEYISQRENRIKRINNNFLVPPVPTPKRSITTNKSTLTPETSTNNSRSDSFTIPETQYCKTRTSLNSSELSVAESIPEENACKIKFNFGNLDCHLLDEDDEFCIPETQEPVQISDNQRQPITLDDKKPGQSTILEENTASADEINAADSIKDIDGSQFRITTQEYNDGFGEEMDSIHSQIIPLIKHNLVVLNSSSASPKNISGNQNNDDKEISSIERSDAKGDQVTANSRVDCVTPDIFDFEQNKHLQAEQGSGNNEPNILEEDEDDLLPTQVFSLPNTKSKEKNILNDNDKPCVEKESEEILTSSDKENKCPVILELMNDLPAPISRPALCNSSRSSISSLHKTSIFSAPSTSTSDSVENSRIPKLLLNLDPDEEDDLLTQAFLLPSNSNVVNTTNKNDPVKCFNSIILDEKSVNKNSPISFAETEKLSVKQSNLSAINSFKVPEKEMSVVKKTSSMTSAASDTDLDLLMCTPQLIKEHLHVDMKDDLRKNILAVKNKHLFGDDTDEEELNDDPTDLVKLINVPKDSKDFDKLLPHLKGEKQQHLQENKEQKAAEEARKEYKFNISFGKEQGFQQTSTSGSTKYSRDERHMARDRERELAERKEMLKSDTKENEKKDRRSKSVKDSSAEKLERNMRSRKRLTSTDETDAKKEEEIQKPRESKKKKIVEKAKAAVNTKNSKENEEKQERSVEESNKTKKSKGREKSDPKNQQKKEKKPDNKESNTKQVENETPAKRITRSKSIYEDKASTSREALNNKTKTSQSLIVIEDDSDSVSTQPFVRKTRGRLNSKNDESQVSTTSISSLSKLTNKSESEMSSNNQNERKRKAETTSAKVERKRLRSSLSQESSDSSNFSSKVYISMTMVDQDLFQELVENSNGLWSIAKNPAGSQILVMDKAFRTFKFLLAMARGIPIVTSEYLRKINELKSIKRVCVTDYLFTDDEFEKKYKFSLAKSLQMAKKQKLFKGYEFLMTQNITPNPSEIKAIIEASGGIVHAKSPSEPKEGQQIYLVSSTEDKKDWHKYRRLNKNITIISTEAIMTSIMRQTCARISSYTLS